MRTVPHLRIDLDLPEKERWKAVISETKPSARALILEASAGLKNHVCQPLLRKAVSSAFKTLYSFSGGHYMGEMEAWARALRVPVEEMVMVQCTYELSHLVSNLPEGPTGWVKAVLGSLPFPRLGCTIGIHEIPGHGLTHFRSLDWPLVTAADASCLFTFEQGDRAFITAGLAGFVGVLSGMLPGAYSVSMNWAPNDSTPTFNFGPAFLLRYVLENCDTYAEARRALRDTELSSNVFFALCGTEEACVIERTATESAVRNYRGKPLVQGNHFISKKFAHLNGDCDLLTKDSGGRCSVLGDLLAANTAGYSKRSMRPILRTYPVRNEQTVHSAVYCPSQGTTDIWAGN
jgi:hypothetical protein